MSVESARDEDQVGAECDCGRRDDALDDADVFRIAAAGGHRHVERRAETAADAGLAMAARARIERELMRRDVRHVRIVLEAVLRAVSVVHIPIEDQDAWRSELRLSHARSDRDVIQETEAHRAVRLGVMARRANRGESARDLVAQRRAHEVDAGSSG